MGGEFMDAYVYGILVIYNKSLNDSSSFHSVNKHPWIRLIVCDNSTQFNDNESICKGNNIDYLSLKGNRGLSFAYNQALDYIHRKNNQMIGKVFFMDDDTILPDEYFTYLRSSSSFISCPIIKDEIGIMSPCFLSNDKGHRIKRIEDFSNSNLLSCINSGLIVDLSIFKNYRYDERFFLDYIDHHFILDMRNRGIYPTVFNVELKQSFSVNDKSNKDGAKKRLFTFKGDCRAFFEKSILSYLIALWRHKIHFMLLYKDISFLWV